MNKVDEIITDSAAPLGIVEKIMDAGIDVTIVDNEGGQIKNRQLRPKHEAADCASIHRSRHIT